MLCTIQQMLLLTTSMYEAVRKSFTEEQTLMLLLKGSILNLSRHVHLCILFLSQQLFIFKSGFL